MNAAAIQLLVDKGLSAEDILDVARALENQSYGATTAKRTRDYRKRRNLSDKEWAALTAQVIERDGWICAYCDCDLENAPDIRHAIDHVMPLSRGGTNDLDNLVMSCQPCNSSKGDKILDEEWTPPNDEFENWKARGGLN